MTVPLIELKQVTVNREQTCILDNVSMTVPRQRHTAILGPNGSGKSSLLKLLTRDFYPSVATTGHQGSVKILGKSEWQVSQLRRRMGIVAPALDHEFSFGQTGRMNVSEAVASGYNATRLKQYGPRIDKAMRSQIEDAIETVGMHAFKNRRVATLSTGERRRTMIARAIVHQPDIFVLDEPTGGLDMAAKADFLEILDRLTRQDLMTIALVTHHLDEVPPEIRHVILLDRGRITYDGAKPDALTSERISNLFRLSVDVQLQDDDWYSSQIRHRRS